MPLTIISLLKQVPLPSEMRMGDDGLMDRTKAKSIINIDCQFALEAGLQLKKNYPDAKMIVCSMGPASFGTSLRKAIAMGFDEAYLLSDRKLGGSDTFATGLALSTLLKHLGYTKDSKEPFIVFAGRQTSDGDTAHVPSQVAENLGIPQATFVERIKPDGKENIVARRIIEGGYQELDLPMPCVISMTPTGIPPRKPTLYGAIKARNAEITTLGVDDIGLGTEKIGLGGSPTIVAAVVNIESDRPPVMMAEGLNETEIVDAFIAGFKKGGNVLHKEEKAEKEAGAASGFPEKDMRNGARGILTWAEIANGDIARPSLEILTPARHLADQLGNDTKIATALIGKDVAHLADKLFEHGVDEVVLVEDDRLEEYMVLPFSGIIAQIIGERKPEIALFGATTAGRELAPRIAVKTGSGVTADCTGLKIGEYANKKEKALIKPILFSRRPTYGDSKLATILGFVCPQISTARAGTFEVPKPQSGRKGRLSTFAPVLNDADFKVKILKTLRGEGGLQSLFDADIIVSGGRGATSDNLALVRQLADALKKQGVKAEWACSRVVVDEGVAEYARQIGQTGKTVRPKVYVSIGISGAIQHIAGIKESGKIVAIDHNPKASIFRHADFGIVGEYEDVVPELIDRVEKGFTFGIGKEKVNVLM
ncbi:MAG: FAD-binding protein [Dysgonamonadaceae bacterium]|jgi:electron transfer flavoprotein alpha subunit|nr:FAD-binding protein [Dysgonamonadaceae bacterium]